MKSQRRWTWWLSRILLYPTLVAAGVMVVAVMFVTLTRYPQAEGPDTLQALTGATVLVGEGLEPHDNATVLVQDGVIVQVGPSDEVDVPADAEVVDLTGATLLPGLIDMHVQLGTPEREPGEPDDWRAVPRSIIDDMRYAPSQRRAMLDHGVTSFRSLDDRNPWILELRGRVAEGELEGPRVFTGRQMLADAGGHPVQTIQSAESIDDVVPVSDTGVMELHDAGVPIVAGSDAPINGLEFGSGLHRELELLVEAGLTPHEALHAATTNAADALRTDDIGAIEPGRDADLLAVDGDPTDDITAVADVHSVWREGRRVVDAEE